MERYQAVALLKEIITLDLSRPTAVYLKENNGKFELVLKDDCSQKLQKFLEQKNLKWRIQKDMGLCIIYKP